MTSRKIFPEPELSKEEEHKESYQDIFVDEIILTNTVFIVLSGIRIGETTNIAFDIVKPNTEERMNKIHVMSVRNGGLVTAINNIAAIPRDIRTFKQAFNKKQMNKLNTIITDDEDVKKVYKLIVTYMRTPDVKNIILIGISYGAVKMALTILKVLEDHKRGLDKLVFFAISSPFIIHKDLLPITMQKKNIDITQEDVLTLRYGNENTSPLPPLSKPYSYATWLVSKYNTRVISFYHTRDPYIKRWLPIAATVTNIRVPTLKRYIVHLQSSKGEYYDTEKGIFIIKKTGLDYKDTPSITDELYLYHANIYILYKVISWRYLLYIKRYREYTSDEIVEETGYKLVFTDLPNVKTEDVVNRSLTLGGKVLLPRQL